MGIFSSSYKYLFKPLAFRQDPEFVHDRITAVGKFLGRTSLGKTITRGLFDFEHPSLEQTVLGIKFRNPIGLAAGFDKNAELVDILPGVGFGFAEVGSVTGQPCPGNPKPRLWRAVKSKSLLVYYGLKNDGAETISKRLAQKKFTIPIGISVAKTNSPDTVERQAGIADYAKAYKAFKDIGSYVTINISCPNAFGGQPFTDPESLEALLSELDTIQSSKPVFVKFSPDLSLETVDALVAVMDRHNVQGIITTNLTKNRNNDKLLENSLPETGGFSGKVVEELSNNMLAHLYRTTKSRYVLVGCGGVFSAEDAYKKIRLGATLIQMITGMIYQGPQVIGEINRGLATLLKRDGFNNISQAVGVDNR